MNRTPKSAGRQSLFFHDLASPVSTRRGGSGKFSTPGQAAAVSALWRENFASSDLPPPPIFTLEDRSDFSPESGIADYPVSPDANSNPRTPVQSSGNDFSTPKNKSVASTSFTLIGNKSEASTSYALMGKQQSKQSPASGMSWWLPGKSGGGGSVGEGDDKGKGSPVDGVVHPGALITLPPPREVARPEMQRNSLPVEALDEEVWVTVYGFSPGDTNLVIREFEKCGVILKHVPGPRDANWMHILYQSRADAQKALGKNGMQINGALIIGVKPVDPMQRQALNQRLNNQGFVPLPPPSSSRIADPISFKASPHPYYLQNGSSNTRQSGGTIAAPAKSVVYKVMDLMFGV